uniref:Chromo domain-containing protein n=1 Tax=Ditylenchus dipsaci TaxID=166011 RepID=A0A915EDD5_9BILA
MQHFYKQTTQTNQALQNMVYNSTLQEQAKALSQSCWELKPFEEFKNYRYTLYTDKVENDKFDSFYGQAVKSWWNKNRLTKHDNEYSWRYYKSIHGHEFSISIESRVSTTSKEDSSTKRADVGIKGASQKTSGAITNKTPTQRKRRGADNGEREVAPPSVVVSPSAKVSIFRHQSDDEPPEYEVEAVVDKKSGKKKAIEYQVKWKGYKELSWEPLKNLHCADLIRAYEDSVKSSRLKSSPAPKRASVHLAEKFSPKHVAPVKVAAIKKRSHSVARKTPVLKSSNHVLQQSFFEQTAEEYLELWWSRISPRSRLNAPKHENKELAAFPTTNKINNGLSLGETKITADEHTKILKQINEVRKSVETKMGDIQTPSSQNSNYRQAHNIASTCKVVNKPSSQNFISLLFEKEYESYPAKSIKTSKSRFSAVLGT